MQHPFLILLLLCASLTATAQDAREQAAQQNKKAETTTKKIENHTVSDSVVYYRGVVDIVNTTLQCDEQDRQPNRKGDVKARYEKANHERLTTYTPQLIDAGLLFSRKKLADEALSAWRLYLKAARHRLIAGLPDESGIAAYYAAQAELSRRSYKAADRFADIALRYDETAQHGAEIKAQCMAATMTTYEDSTRYLAVLTQLYKTAPTNPEYFAWIMKFYSHPSAKHNLTNFIDQQLDESPDSYVPWVLKAEVAMSAKRWDEAIEAYRQADALSHDMVPIIYNIGVCLNNKVMEMQETKTGTKAEAEALLVQSRNYLERVRAKDPNQKQVKWVGPLYLAYTLLGDKIHADELEPIVKGFK